MHYKQVVVALTFLTLLSIVVISHFHQTNLEYATELEVPSGQEVEEFDTKMEVKRKRIKDVCDDSEQIPSIEKDFDRGVFKSFNFSIISAPSNEIDDDGEGKSCNLQPDREKLPHSLNSVFIGDKLQVILCP